MKLVAWLRFGRLGATALVAVLLGTAQPAAADLMLFPTRIVLENDARSAQIELVNRDATVASYKISVLNRRMTESGEIVEAKDVQPGETFADGMVLFTPRLVTLQPGASQVVRIVARRPAGLAEGEYRTHLQFDRLPDVEAASDIEKVREQTPKGVASIKLTALIGASIPVIIRQGNPQATATLAALAIDRLDGADRPALAFEMRRSGNRSVYGDITATYQPPTGKAVEVGAVGGVAVYAPNSVRKARLPLNLPAGLALKGGTLTLRYAARPDAGGETMAQSEIAVP